MAEQTSSNVVVALRREDDFGVPPAAGAGAMRLRIVDGQGLELTRGQIRSAERKPNGITAMGRLGSKSVAGTYPTELTVGGAIDDLLSALMRGEWTAPLVITEATSGLTSITTTATEIVAAAGSWITAGVRVGDVITLTGHASGANNGKLFRVIAVTATKITLAGVAPLTVNAVADNSFTVTVLKKLINPAAPSHVSYGVEQLDVDILESELFLGVRCVGLQLSFRPNSVVQCQWTFAGVNRNLLQSGTAPYFTNPVATTGIALVADDSKIRYQGEDIVNLTGFDLQFQIANNVIPVIGSTTPPNVYDNDFTPSGSVTAIRTSLDALADFDAETEFEFSTLLTEPGSQNGIGLYLPRVKIAQVSAPVMGGDGAKIETRQLMVGDQAASSGRDATAIAFHSTGA